MAGYRVQIGKDENVTYICSLWERNHSIHWASHTDHVFCVTPRLSTSLKLMWAVNTLNRILTPHCPEGILCPQECSWELASNAVNLWVAECPCPGHAGHRLWGWPGGFAVYLPLRDSVLSLLPRGQSEGVTPGCCEESVNPCVCVCSVIRKAWQKHVLSVQRMFFSS